MDTNRYLYCKYLQRLTIRDIEWLIPIRKNQSYFLKAR